VHFQFHSHLHLPGIRHGSHQHLRYFGDIYAKLGGGEPEDRGQLRLKRLKSHFHMPYMCFPLGSNIYYTNRWRSVCDFVFLLANLHTSMPNVGFVFRRVCALFLTNELLVEGSN